MNLVEVAQLIARDQIAEDREERERETEEDRDAADARLRLLVHAPLADFIDHADVRREFTHQRRRERGGERGERDHDAENRQQRKGRHAVGRRRRNVRDHGPRFGQQYCPAIGSG